jgi:hypothetical protein
MWSTIEISLVEASIAWSITSCVAEISLLVGIHAIVVVHLSFVLIIQRLIRPFETFLTRLCP